MKKAALACITALLLLLPTADAPGGTRIPGCGGDGEPVCSDAPVCDLWRTINPGFPTHCIACGGDNYYRCQVDPSVTPTPKPCRARHTINPNDVQRCVACGGPGQVPCEPTTNSTVIVPTQTAGGPLWGWADMHTHMFANEAYGGATLWGKPFDVNGVNRALATCDYTWDFVTQPSWIIDGVSALGGPIFSTSNGSLAFTSLHAGMTGGYPVHGTNWVTWHALMPTQTLFGLPVNIATGNIDAIGVDFNDPATVFNFINVFTGAGMHHNVGMTNFWAGSEANHGWPHFLDGAHTQMYHKWVERAYQGGLRLLVDLPVNNEILCSFSIRRAGYTCDDMDAVLIQIARVWEMQEFIDRDNDGLLNGNGWYRVALSPQEARAIIEDGAMAVIIGAEVDSLFGCKPGRPECGDPVWLGQQIQTFWDLGVRHIYPVHLFDNEFAGAALYMWFIDYANYLSTERAFTKVDCSGLTQSGPDGTTVPAGYDMECNARGLTAAGTTLLTALMDQGMIIDIDHFSHFALEGDHLGDPYSLGNQAVGVLELMEDRGYPPLSGHGVITANGAANSELGHTEARAERLLRMGGMIPMNPSIRHGETIAAGDEPGTADQFVFGQLASGTPARGFLDIVALSKRAIVANNQGKTPADADWLDPQYPSVGLASDLGAFVNRSGPRFNDAGFRQYTPRYGTTTPALDYPFESFEPVYKEYPAGTKTGHFYEQRTGSRRFDFNIDGQSHYGLTVDLLADARNILAAHQTANPTEEVPTLDPILHSAEAFIRMWERIPTFSNPSDADGDGIVDGSDNCVYIANSNQFDRDNDGTGDACDTDVDGDGTDDDVDDCIDLCPGGPGTCTLDPCCSMVCDSPPNTRCYEPTGSCSAGACSYFQKAAGTICDDDDPCTYDDSCDAGGTCGGISFSEGSACDDGDYCTHGDACDAGGACVGTTYSCPSPNQCEETVACNGDGGCVVISKYRGLPCDDADDCTRDDVCDGLGVCGGTEIICTPGQCDLTATCNGTDCDYTPQPSGIQCDDDVDCTHTDVCDGAGSCGGETYACDNPAECEASLACDGLGGCIPTGTAAGTACTPDALWCTDDACDGLGRCAHAVQANACLVGGACFADGDVNPDAQCWACDAAADPFDFTVLADGTSCSSATVCGGACGGGICTGGWPIDCDDQDQCTADACDEGTFECTHVARTGMQCDDGDADTVNDLCDASGVCAGTDRGSDPSPSGGCGCRGGAEPGDGALLLGALFLLVRRRRRY